MSGATSIREVDIPNSKTIAAMLEARRGNVQSYGSLDQMFKDIRCRERTSINRAYITKNRRFRNWAYITIKNQIRSQAGSLGGVFATDNTIEQNSSQIGAYFLGRRRRVVYLLDLETTYAAYKRVVTELALCRLDPGSTTAQIRDCVEMIANSGEVSVREEWSVKYDYKYGIGVHAIIEQPSLGIKAVNQFIARFLQTEEVFQAEALISYRYDQVNSWGLGPIFPSTAKSS